MTRLEDRRTLMCDIAQACAEGARLAPACALAGIAARTLQRWKIDGLTRGDRRPDADRPAPSHALSEAERARIIEVANEPRFAATPPARIIPALADEGLLHRQRVKLPPRAARVWPDEPPGPCPRAPNIGPAAHAHRHAPRRGLVLGCDVPAGAGPTDDGSISILILDLYSRKIVGFEVHDTDSAEHAAHLARRTALAEGMHAMPTRPVLHGDNGASLKATTVLAMLHWLGIKPSYSRPRVSDDNAFAEALFRTAKYRPEFPLKGFADLDGCPTMGDADSCSGITTSIGTAASAMLPRHSVMPAGIAVCSKPATRSIKVRGNATHDAGVGTRATGRVGIVTLNPERDAYVQAAGSQIKLSGSIGEPAFPSRPGNAQATEHNGGDGRRGATRSHAQRTSLREHGEDGEHRTFSAVSAVAHSPHAGDALRRTPNRQLSGYDNRHVVTKYGRQLP